MQSGKLLNILKDTGAMLDGHFLLTSGRHSNVYIEKFRVLEDPHALDGVCWEMAEIVKDQNIELVMGAAMGGILIAGGVGRHLGVKHIFSERVNGKMELLNCKMKDEVLKEEKDLIEDLIISAVNNALSKAQAESRSRMNSATGGMLGGMKLPGM